VQVSGKNYEVALLMAKVEVEVPDVSSDVITLTVYAPVVKESGIVAKVQVTPVDVGVERLAQGTCCEPSDDTRVIANVSAKFCPVIEKATEVAPREALVGLKLEITGDAAPMVNAFCREADWLSGFVTSTFAMPAARLLRSKVPVIWVDETETPVACIGRFPGWTRLAVAPVWKLLPVIVKLALVPVAPLVGDIAVIAGPLPESVVVTVVGMVGVATVTDVADTWESFTVYNFSISARGNSSVVAVSRPQLPSEFFTSSARSY
jgi:hypothetical protein